MYNEQKHYDMLKKWCEDRNIPAFEKELIPKIGFVVNDLIMGFLYQTDSGIMLIESYISDKNSDKEKRKESMKTLTETLLTVAHQLGAKIVMTMIKDDNMSNHFKPYNFNEYDSSLKLAIRRM